MITNPLCISFLPDIRRLRSPYEPPYLHRPLGPERPPFILQATLLRKTRVQPIDLKAPSPPSRQSKQGKPKSATTSNIPLPSSPHSPKCPRLFPFARSRTSTSEISMSMGAIGLYISMITLWQECTMIYGCRSARQARSVGRLCMGCRGMSTAGG